jgi:hypothetical protein
MQSLRLLLIAGLALVAVYVAPTPWALHIGGQSTPLESWSGYGTVQASNGGRYVLFIQFRGGIMARRGRPSCSAAGCRNMFGTAELCTESGKTHAFTLSGTVRGWWTTDGSRTSIDLTGGTPERLPSGWVVAFHGIWNGPVLSLDSLDNSFTKAFTPTGAIRHVTSTADNGAAHTTLGFGSEAGFASACRLLTDRLH